LGGGISEVLGTAEIEQRSLQNFASAQPETHFYSWRGYTCAYEVRIAPEPIDLEPSPLLLLHPIGVGLSRRFWRRDWEAAIANIHLPTLVVIGNQASSISKSGKGENPNERLGDYLRHLSQGEGMQVTGRNVLPYESTEKFVKAIAPFVHR
jgi:hypothetical protein